MTVNIGRFRWTEDEKHEVFAQLAEQLQPKAAKADAKLIPLSETWEEAQKLKGDENGIGGLSTGYKNIDDITGGLRSGQLIVVFGDTGHGKSMLTQNITYNIAASGKPVLFIGLEMTNAENTERMQNFGATPDLPVLYPEANDVAYTDIDGMVAAGMKAGIELVVVDHLHMFSQDGTNTTADFLTMVCTEMKSVAIKYRIPVVLVSHIKERTEEASRNIPELRDLKGSSSIKQLADSALAVWNRGEVYMLSPGEMPELTIMQRKTRRGRKQRQAKLRIMDNARLAEMNFTQQVSRPTF